MRKLFLTLLGVAALIVPRSATAQIIWSSPSQCGGTHSAICATWTLSLSGSTYRLELTNTSSNANSMFKSIALGDSDASVSWDVSNFQSSHDWSLVGGNGNAWNGYGLVSPFLVASANQPNQDGLAPGGSIWFTWTMTASAEGATINELAIHDLKGILDGNGRGVDSDKAVFRAQVTPPPTVVPEPATLALLATGLVGVGAVARRRQRKA